MSIYKEVSGQGRDVVIIHGWGCDSRYMQPIANQLSSNYRVTNIDLPGRGKSAWQTDIKNIHDIADIVLPHLPKQAIYIPWSFGGLVTLSIASRHPERVDRMIGIATSPKFVEVENWPGVPTPGFQASFDAVKTLGVKNFFQGFCDSEFVAFDPKPNAYHQLLQLLHETPEIDLDILMKGIYICDETDLRSEFKSLRCPVDLVFGEKDSSIPLAAHAAIKQLNSKAQFHVITGAQHMPFWTHPADFQEVLQAILEK